MDEEAFSLIALSFTGTAALRWQLDYVHASYTHTLGQRRSRGGAVTRVATREISDEWHGQFERIKRNPILNEGVRIIRIPSLNVVILTIFGSYPEFPDN
jgi:hypothetical protein